MIYLIFWSFMAYGMTSILVWGSIFESFRTWLRANSTFFGDLISCTLCTSTWVGFFLSVILGGMTTKMFGTNYYVGIFLDGMYTAGTVWAINAIIEYYENRNSN
jgi:hypothetical protein